MVEIIYKDSHEVADLAGQSIAETREQFKAEFGIPDKANARLNGKKVKGNLETETCLKEDDTLTFSRSSSKGVFLLGALLLALAITGGVFAFGWINATTTLSAGQATNDFAAVSVNDSVAVSWSPYGFYKGSISTSTNGTSIFNVDTAASTYDGDLAVTVSFSNADTLAKCYRVLALKLMMYDSSENILDINSDNATGYLGDDDDYVLLTLGNGAVDLFPGGLADTMTVRVKSGFYITHIYKGSAWTSGYQPDLFCEVAQR